MAGSRVGSNSFYLVLKVFVASVLGLAQMKLFTAFLDLNEMGLLQSLRGLGSLVTAVALLGLPNLAVRFLPQLETRGERRRILGVSGLLLLAQLILFAAVGLIAWQSRHFLGARVGLAPGQVSLLPQVLLLALGIGLTEFSYALYQGVRRMGPVAVAEASGMLLVTVHLTAVRATLTAGQVLSLLGVYFLVRSAMLLGLFWRFLPQTGTSDRKLRVSARDLAGYWGLSLVLRLLAMAYLDLDRFVIGLVGALDVVALFHIPAKLVALSKSLLAAPAVSLQTEVSRFYEERREDELPRYLQLYMRGQLAVTLWLAAALFLLGRPLILLTSNENYLPAVPLLGILLFSLPLTGLIAPFESAFRGLHGLRVVLLGNLLWALGYFGSLAWLLRKLGLTGLGIALLGGTVLQVSWVLTASARRGWLRGVGASLRRSCLLGVVPALIAIGSAFLFPGRVASSPSSAGILVGLLLLMLGAWFALRGHGLFAEEEKRWLHAQMRHRAAHNLAAKLLNLRGEAR